MDELARDFAGKNLTPPDKNVLPQFIHSLLHQETNALYSGLLQDLPDKPAALFHVRQLVQRMHNGRLLLYIGLHSLYTGSAKACNI